MLLTLNALELLHAIVTRSWVFLHITHIANQGRQILRPYVIVHCYDGRSLLASNG